MDRKMKIEELEAILNSEEEKPIKILPNGEIAAADSFTPTPAGYKPLTMKEDLGGEYVFGFGRKWK